MRPHLYFIAALLLIAFLFAKPDAARPDGCEQWDKPIVFVTTAWAASQICKRDGWKPGPVLLHTLSMGARLNMYPWAEVGEPSCIAFIQDSADEASRLFQADPKNCENVNKWLDDPELKSRLIWLGVVD